MTINNTVCFPTTEPCFVSIIGCALNYHQHPLVVWRNDELLMKDMELKVWVDGVQRVVCGVTEFTTCQEVVIALAQAIGKLLLLRM